MHNKVNNISYYTSIFLPLPTLPVLDAIFAASSDSLKDNKIERSLNKAKKLDHQTRCCNKLCCYHQIKKFYAREFA